KEPAAQLWETLLEYKADKWRLIINGGHITGNNLDNGTQKPHRAGFDKAAVTWFYIAALAAAFALRSVLAIYTEGHPIDVGTFKAWAVRAATVGLGGFYSEDVFADYPPGYVYIFYLIGKIKNAISLTDASKSFLLLIKLPSMITDIAAAHIVFLMARRNFSKAAAATLALAYALNPAILVNCAVWGQVDSVFSLCVLVFITLIAQGRLNAGAAAFAVAVLVKPQGLIFTPILIFALSRVSLNNAAAAVGLAVTVFTAAILPFTINKAPLWIFKHYYTTLSSYPYASLNAFNLHALMGGNWAPVTDRVLGVTYEFWGYMFIALAVGLCAFIFYKKKDTATDTAGMYWFISTVLITSAFVVSTRMHERYLFAGLVLLLICYINIRDKRLLYLYAFVSVTFFINEAYVLYYGMKELYHIDTYDVVVEIVSAAHVGVLVYLIKLGCDIYIRKPMPAAAAVINAPPLPPTLSLAGKDYAAIAIITLFNLAVMYYGIGCSKAPETFWSSAEGQRSLWADLGRQQNL
ncbi:MAG: hypothetical protein HQK97_12700, partial [Nitrospirae bacterium]|nr:hypothetical protein [Nitrospirota bacterium]